MKLFMYCTVPGIFRWFLIHQIGYRLAAIVGGSHHNIIHKLKYSKYDGAVILTSMKMFGLKCGCKVRTVVRESV
jgi:hypothetical protein